MPCTASFSFVIKFDFHQKQSRRAWPMVCSVPPVNCIPFGISVRLATDCDWVVSLCFRANVPILFRLWMNHVIRLARYSFKHFMWIFSIQCEHLLHVLFYRRRRGGRRHRCAVNRFKIPIYWNATEHFACLLIGYTWANRTVARAKRSICFHIYLHFFLLNLCLATIIIPFVYVVCCCCFSFRTVLLTWQNGLRWK